MGTASNTSDFAENSARAGRWHCITSPLTRLVAASGAFAWLRRMLRAQAAILGIMTLFALAGQADARSVALVIGNNNYENVTSLQTAVNDARAVGDKLESLGFVVQRAFNVDQRAMSRALVSFNSELRPGDRAFFFYSGHGFEVSGANYLLPTDVPYARSNQIELALDAAFSVEGIINGIRGRAARVTVVILDACRDNPFDPRNTRSSASNGGLAQIVAPEGVFVLMSAGAKQEALDRLWDNDGEVNSVFTRTFLSELAAPHRTLVQIAKATQIGVRDLAASIGYVQTPAYYDQVIGDIVLSDDAPEANAETDQVRTRVAPAMIIPDSGNISAVLLSHIAPAAKIVAAPASFDETGASCRVMPSSPKVATTISWRLTQAGAKSLSAEGIRNSSAAAPGTILICLAITWPDGS